MLNTLKHFSFDLWFTLIKSNPAFKKERALYFYKNFNSLKKNLIEVEDVFRNVDLMCNAINEKTGKNIESEEMYLMVIYQLNNSNEVFEKIDTAVLYSDLEKLFFQYPPIVFNNETNECLDRIKQKKNVTLNLLSNTAFIKGATLRKLNDYLQLSKYFDFQIYSDEEGLSKPNPSIYSLLLKRIAEIRQSNTIVLDEIVHIGDNVIADIYGARAVGINAFQINSNNKTIIHLFQ